LRIVDGKLNWRIMYIASEAIVILDVFKKQTEATPNAVIETCQRRLADFNRLTDRKKDSHHA
jgi:phage-related protein